MTAAELLEELRRRGIQPIVDGDRLGFRAPRGALTPALQAAVRRHKRELLNILQDRPPFWPLEAWQPAWGWVAARDPFTGETYEIRWRDCPDWLRRRAQGEARRRETA